MDDAIGGKKTKKRGKFNFQRLKDSWKWKFLRDFKWKRLNLQIGFIDVIIFRIASLFEAVALVGIAGFFFLCCGGCRFWSILRTDSIDYLYVFNCNLFLKIFFDSLINLYLRPSIANENVDRLSNLFFCFWIVSLRLWFDAQSLIE